MKPFRTMLVLLIIVMLAICTPAAAASKKAQAPVDDPWGEFAFTPRIGYAYLGGQAGYTSSSAIPFNGESFNCMQIKLDLNLGGKGAAFEFGPYYMLESAAINGDKLHGVGFYLGYLYSWLIPTKKAGVFYPGVGFGFINGFLTGDSADYGFNFIFRVPVSISWYPSKKTEVGIVLEWAPGFHTLGAWGTKDMIMSYGFYTDLTLGVRLF
jgi:hypothetical protein